MSLYKIFPFDLENQTSTPLAEDYLMLSDSSSAHKAKKVKLSVMRNYFSGEFALLDDLHSVAFSGNYNELNNRPNITQIIEETSGDNAMLYALIFG